MTARFLMIPLALFVTAAAVSSPAMAKVKTFQPSVQILLDDDELLKQGRDAVHSGELEKAIVYYEEALNRQNLSRVEETIVHSDLCVAYMYVERFPEAIDQCQASLEMQPNRWETLNNLGTVYLIMGDYDKAVEVYERALKMKPHSQILLFNKEIAEKRAQEMEIRQDIQRQKEDGGSLNDSGVSAATSNF